MRVNLGNFRRKVYIIMSFWDIVAYNVLIYMCVEDIFTGGFWLGLTVSISSSSLCLLSIFGFFEVRDETGSK